MSEKRYESTFLLPTTLSEESSSAVIKRFEDIITKNGGTLIETEHWGVRRLAYPIKKQNNAVYVSLHYSAPSGTNAKLERAYHLDEDILRWLTLEMPEANFAARAAMKARVESVEARKTAYAAAKESEAQNTES